MHVATVKKMMKVIERIVRTISRINLGHDGSLTGLRARLIVLERRISVD